MSYRLKLLSRILLVTLVLSSIPLVMQASLSPSTVVEAGNESLSTSDSTCAEVQLDLKAANTMSVPEFCIDGLCKLILYTDGVMGAFGPGYIWEVYYFQLSEFEARWNGGPNINFSGVEFSEGFGYNGNGIPEGIFLGPTNQEGGYVRIMDDGDSENSPNLWTIESRASETLTKATLQVCDIPGEVWSGHISESTTIDVPDFCIDQLCMILRWTDATFGSFGPGLSMPVYYYQESSGGEPDESPWIGGPSVYINSVGFSAGSGVNGDSFGEVVFEGGEADGGGHAILYDDDGLEVNNSQWNVVFESGDILSEVFYYFAPMDCDSYSITEQYTNLSPTGCLGSLCTVVRWTDAYMGIFGPGLSWPVNYKQDTADNSWIGGPALAFGGVSFSDGLGVNGDTSAEEIFDGGRTSPNSGYVVLRDDSVTATETDPNYWNVVFNPLDDLTAARYFICSNTCSETVLMIQKQFLPLIKR